MTNIKTCSKDNFEKEITNSSLPVLIDFYADWCAPCRKMMPILEELSKEYSDTLKICKIDIDASSDLAAKFAIMTIPTFIIFKDGKKKDVNVASLPKKDLKAFIDKNIK